MKRIAVCQMLFAVACTSFCYAQDDVKQDDANEAELAKLQGTWVREARDSEGNVITITKTVDGKRETVVAMRGDEVLQKHVVDFAIERTANVRIFTYRNLTVTAGPNAGVVQKDPVSYLYRIEDNRWICIEGAMADDEQPLRVDVYRRKRPDPPGGKTR